MPPIRSVALEYSHITSKREGAFAVITMCVPERRNALSETHLRELLDAFTKSGAGAAGSC
jgi:enoyl-CoA hydratase/carnithine racemase